MCALIFFRYSERNLAEFIVSMAMKVKGPKDLHKKLLENEFPDTMDTLSFCNQLLEKLGRAGGGKAASSGAVLSRPHSNAPASTVTNADLLRKSLEYKLVDMDATDHLGSIKHGQRATEKSEKKSKKLMRKKASEDGSSSEDDTKVRRKASKIEEAVEAESEEAQQQRERAADIAERDAFVSRMLEREEKKTKKIEQGGLSASQIEQLATRGVIAGDKGETRYSIRNFISTL